MIDHHSASLHYTVKILKRGFEKLSFPGSWVIFTIFFLIVVSKSYSKFCFAEYLLILFLFDLFIIIIIVCSQYSCFRIRIPVALHSNMGEGE